MRAVAARRIHERRRLARVSTSGCHWFVVAIVSGIRSTTGQRLDVEVPGQPVDRRRAFASRGPLAVVLVVAGAGPSPIGRPLAELSTDQVIVDVGPGGFHGRHCAEVPIVAAFLPASKAVDPGPLADGPPPQQRASIGFQTPLDPRGERGLDRLQQQDMEVSPHLNEYFVREYTILSLLQFIFAPLKNSINPVVDVDCVDNCPDRTTDDD
jgi:hypothetical protein